MAREEAPLVTWASDSAVRIEFGDAISPEVRRRVHAAYRALRAADLPGLLDVTPAYTTILLTFDLRESGEGVLAGVGMALEGVVDAPPPPGRTIEIPTCYEGECAPDLEQVGAMHRMSTDRVVELHATAEYHVDFLGFSPGFAYLSGLPAELETPRLERPRARVPAGSVAIGGAQTGVYPHATPGGWRIIGRTPVRVFDEGRDPPALLAMGDRVRFVTISAERFGELEGRC